MTKQEMVDLDEIFKARKDFFIKKVKEADMMIKTKKVRENA